jgi:predicted PurR-regulated permease PerM
VSDLPAAARERLRVLLITVAVLSTLTVLALLAWRITHVLLVIFAAVLLAILLDGLARMLVRRLRLGHLTALGLGLMIVAAVLAGFGFLAGPQVSEQLGQLGERLPEAVAQIRATIEAQAWGRALLRNAPAPAELVASPGDVLGQISGVFSTALGTVVNLSIILIMGLYLAANPAVYLDGLRLLVPQNLRPRVEEVLGALGQALRWWLIGRISSMVAVGVLTGIGLWIIDMPLALALALTAGLFAFVPLVGPIISAVPAVLLGLLEDPVKAAYALGVYSGVQFLEGNFITPLIQKQTVSLPPAVLLTAQLLMGVLFGFLGVLLATPLAVTAIVLIQMLYVQDLLGSRVRVLGQHRD